MKLRALIVEDCAPMRKVLMQVLSLTGLAEFEFVEAQDGSEGLAKLSASKIDILFVDWNMPRLSGIDFVRRARTTAKTAHIPIVMVTGNKTAGNIQEALDGGGADVYVTKPYTVDDLHQKLAKLMARMAVDQAESSAKHPSRFWSGLIGGKR
jgi:two-component system, chemotaxis family, chemotaxis protein CheY